MTPRPAERWLAITALIYGAAATFASTYFYVTAFGHSGSSGAIPRRLAVAPVWTWQLSITAAALVAAFLAAVLDDALRDPRP